MPDTKNEKNPSKSKSGFLGRWIGGFWREQKEMAFGERHKRFLAETAKEAHRLRNLPIEPSRVETFEEAIERMDLTPQVLQAQLRRFKNAHLAFYGLSGVLLVYALYLALNFSALMGIGALFAAVAAAVNGYLHGFRAWQIQNRNLIRLQDALRVSGTYLVL